MVQREPVGTFGDQEVLQDVRPGLPRNDEELACADRIVGKQELKSKVGNKLNRYPVSTVGQSVH